jgi:hypothetical protein
MISEIAPATNSTYKKLAAKCPAESFMVNQTFVLRLNICGKNRQLLVAANRWPQPHFCFASKVLYL